MKKFLYLCVVMIAIALTSCGGPKTIDDILTTADDKITAEDIQTMSDYLHELNVSAEDVIKENDPNLGQRLQKWYIAHKDEYNKAIDIYAKLDKLPKKDLVDSEALNEMQNFLGLSLVMSMTGIQR